MLRAGFIIGFPPLATDKHSMCPSFCDANGAGRA